MMTSLVLSIRDYTFSLCFFPCWFPTSIAWYLHYAQFFSIWENVWFLLEETMGLGFATNISRKQKKLNYISENS